MTKKIIELYDDFEEMVNRTIGDAVRADENKAMDLWGALANVDWIYNGVTDSGFTFRSAGAFVARLRCDGTDYMEWYCCKSEGEVPNWIADAFGKEGWTYKEL